MKKLNTSTAGIELELHDICIALFKKKKNQPFEYYREGGVTNLFSLKDVTCTSDVLTTGAEIPNELLRECAENQKVKMGDEIIEIEIPQYDMNGKKSFYPSISNIFEFSTNPLGNIEEFDQAVSRIRIIVEHLNKYLTNHFDSKLVSLKNWVDNFNFIYTDPDMKIKIDLPEDVELLIITKTRNNNPDPRNFLYYPQFNFTTSLEQLGTKSLSKLCPEILESAKKRGGVMARRVINQIAILEAAQNQACSAAEYLRARFRDADHYVKFRKIQGLFFILSYYVLTEMNAYSGSGSNKNKYLFYIKNSVTEIYTNCLSIRDKKILSQISIDSDDVLKLLVGDLNLDCLMYKFDNKDVTVRMFLLSSLDMTPHSKATLKRFPNGGNTLTLEMRRS